MRADPDAQTAKAHSKATRSGTEVVCAAVRQNIELSGDDHAPVTRGRMRAQYPLPHGPCPTNTMSNEHFPFGPYFLGTQLIRYLIRYQTSEQRF